MSDVQPVRRLTALERLLNLFTDVRPGEGMTGAIMLLNIFLILAAYYFIKPVREGWLAVSAIKDLSKIEIKAYSSFGQSLCCWPLFHSMPNWQRCGRGRKFGLFAGMRFTSTPKSRNRPRNASV